MCNLYSITTNQAAIIALFRVVNRYVGNLAPMPGVFPDYKAPIVRNGTEGRELVTARWGMPSSSKAQMDATKNSAICRPTAQISIRSKMPSPSSRRTCESQPREPSTHLTEPLPMHCQSSNLTNARTSSRTQDIAHTWHHRIEAAVEHARISEQDNA
jgi:putative SOS response-associated peptidase YedK